MVSLLSTLLLVGAAAVPAQAEPIAAWWNGIGPQLLVHNATTNQIRYSACNAYDEAVYSYTDGSVLSLSHKPKVGGAVSGVGWWNQKYTVASIFFISDQGSIINAIFNCNMDTGLFGSQGEWVISGDAPSIHNNSGLASVVLGSTAGYRVYYHDSDGAVNELAYTTDTDWHYNGIVSHDINTLPALAATFNSGSTNITVVSPRDDQNIAAMRWRADGVWARTTFPHPLDGSLITNGTNRSDITVNETAAASLFTLPAWDGKTQSLGISLDSASTRTVWYLGNDSNLYSVANQNYTWSVRANQSNAIWPKADTANGQLAVASDQTSSMVRIYYVVKGLISEVTYENGGWKAWSAVATPTASSTTAATASATNSAVADTESSGLSTGAKAGIGVGVSLGAIALGAIIAVLVLARRKKQQGFQQPPYADEGSTTVGPETPAMSYGSPTTLAASSAPYEPYGWEQQKNHSLAGSPPPEHMQVHQLDGNNAPTELFARPLYELANHSDTHELGADVPPSRQGGANPNVNV